MTLIYVGLITNFIFLAVSWILFFKTFQRKAAAADLRLQVKSLREDVDLVTKNPASARRKLKGRK